MTLGSTARDNRDKAFAEFLRGMSIGYVALMLRLARRRRAGDGRAGPGQAGRLQGGGGLGDTRRSQRAIDYANAAGHRLRRLPAPGDMDSVADDVMSAAEFVKLVRSYRARIRANMARTPAERAAVDWAAVIADAQDGITADHYHHHEHAPTDRANAWRAQYESFSTWHQMPPFIIGMADVSGSYAAWIAQPVGQRGAGNQGFFMVDPGPALPAGCDARRAAGGLRDHVAARRRRRRASGTS